MNRLRVSLNLPPEVLTIDQLGTPIAAGHVLGEQTTYFPLTANAARPPSQRAGVPSLDEQS
jgi:methionyl-tRNA synthetase